MAESYRAKFSDITLATTRIRSNTKSLIAKEEKIRKLVAELEQQRDALQTALFHKKKDAMTIQKAVDHEISNVSRKKSEILKVKTNLQNIIKENKSIHDKKQAMLQDFQTRLESLNNNLLQKWINMHHQEISDLTTSESLHDILNSPFISTEERETLSQCHETFEQEELSFREQCQKAHELRKNILFYRHYALQKQHRTEEELLALERAWAQSVPTDETIETQLFYGDKQEQ